jgi:hypothetical protein
MPSITKLPSIPKVPSITKVTKDSQAQILAGVKQGQKVVVEGVSASAKLVGQRVPGLPVASKSLAKTEQVVESTFDYAEKLIGTQRRFTRAVISAASPVVRKSGTTSRPSASSSSQSVSASAKRTATATKRKARATKRTAKAKAPIKTS